MKTKTNITFKIRGVTFNLNFTTKRKTCSTCNGKGQALVWDTNSYDQCDDCAGGMTFESQILNTLEGDGNIFSLKKYLSDDDFEKLELAQAFNRECDKSFDYEKEPYQETPHWVTIKREGKNENNQKHN